MNRLVLCSLLLGGCLAENTVEPTPEPAPAATCTEADVAASLRALPRVTAVAAAPCGDAVLAPATCFEIKFDQPIDHAAPQGKTFSQRLQLVHRGCDRPMVVADWGYESFGFFDDELSALFESNSLWIEHRFQGQSVPLVADWDWKSLTIHNGASDMHDVIATFRKHYGGRWVSTGASKGGVTASYHKYFYADDLDGTVPYVAPASRQRVDPSYQNYLDAVLPQPCSQRIRDVQVAALTTRRSLTLGKLATAVGPELAPLYLEYIMNSLDWAFWQYYGVDFCSEVPAATASDQVFWAFINDFYQLGIPAPGSIAQMSDGALSYEWLTEQGFALQVNSQVRPLLVEPEANETMADGFRVQFPEVTLPAYDGSVTATVRHWARTAEDVLLIYGQYDPWSGGALDEPRAPSSGRFFVPGATHGAQMAALSEADRKAALALAAAMFGREPIQNMARARQAGDHRNALLDAYTRRDREIAWRLHSAQ